ncbi:MAG: V-type ATP synthase subunit D [Planctomycetota bacterium]
MLQNVNATRMELLSLRKRVGLALRGHRLLSEKRDEICRQLVQIARDLKSLRSKVEVELLETTRRFMMWPGPRWNPNTLPRRWKSRPKNSSWS